MAELADAVDSNSIIFQDMQVQVLLGAVSNNSYFSSSSVG